MTPTEITDFVNSLDERQANLLSFVRKAHEGQTRKYTLEPYWHHPVRVANIVKDHPLGIEVALCHDLFEMTDVTEAKLLEDLETFGYTSAVRILIVRCVGELTEPLIASRKDRKTVYNSELRNSFQLAATVKCADIQDNIYNISDVDRDFAKKYLLEKEHQLQVLSHADAGVLEETRAMLEKRTAKTKI